MNLNLKEQLQSILSQCSSFAQRTANSLSKKIQNITQPSASVANGTSPSFFANRFEKIRQHIEKRGAGFYGSLVTTIICSYLLAGVTSILATHFIPQPSPVKNMHLGSSFKSAKSAEDYAAIYGRNLFNSKGLIPGEDQPVNAGGMIADNGGAPVKSSLPFNLIGILALRDEMRSIATIEDKSVSMVYPVRAEDEIPMKARIIKIENNRVVFLNMSNGRREYIELPQDLYVSNARISLGTLATKPGIKPSGAVGAGIERVSATEFNISRAEVDKTLADLNVVLTQARCVPNFKNGLPFGYKCFQIVPGSIYDKLGMQNGDVIAGINGQPVADPGKAFEMLSELKTASHLDLSLERDGKNLNHSYSFH